jgi:hypothetical protein
MRVSRGQRVALALWAAFAFVTWNVVFDRHVYVTSVRYTQEQIRRHDRGERVSSIEEAFTPELGSAARRATMWSVAVLGVGVVLVLFLSRPTRD